ncbi:MAG: radical SAM protein [Prevotella sp.]|nr:radical SAM protein [Prevotella sp.]
METIGWDKIRFLVSNGCNYKCPFCHNEGQVKSFAISKMSFDNVRIIIDVIKDVNISEICFSGGEPFLNEDIVRMIEYACNETVCDVCCASNLSLITDDQIKALSETRVKFNIQFPYIDKHLFKSSTGNGNINDILYKIEQLRKAGIQIGLNTVIQNQNMDNIKEMVMFALKEEIPLKLLPQIGLEGSEHFKDFVYPILKEYAIDYKDKKSGAIRWTLKSNNHQTIVLYIDAPCFNKNIHNCRNYGELRILPNMSAQTCILKDASVLLETNKGKDVLLEQFLTLWKNFKHC